MSAVRTGRRAPSRRARLVGVLVAATVAMSAASLVGASPAGAAINDRISSGTWNVRSAPGGAVIGSVGGGQAIVIDCQSTAGWITVNGFGSSPIWDRISYPINGWVSDLGVFSTAYQRRDPRLPECSGSPAPAPAPVSSTAERAAQWAIAEKNSRLPYWSDQLGRPWSGWCEAFAEIAYGTRGRMPSAIAHYNLRLRKGQIRRDANPPRGAFVFYGGGGGFGHIGISIGGGQVISTQGFYGQRLPVWQHSVRGISNPYLGWAFFDGTWS